MITDISSEECKRLEYCQSCRGTGEKDWRKSCRAGIIEEECPVCNGTGKQKQVADLDSIRNEFENIVCDIETALYATEETRISILTKSLESVKYYINKHFK